jgi:hypothetical protein
MAVSNLSMLDPETRALLEKYANESDLPLLDTAASFGSGLLGAIPAGLQGMGELLAGHGLDRAAAATNATQEALTYVPRTERGRQNMQNIGGVFEGIGRGIEALPAVDAASREMVMGQGSFPERTEAARTAFNTAPALSELSNKYFGPEITAALHTAIMMGTPGGMEKGAVKAGAEAAAKPAPVFRHDNPGGAWLEGKKTAAAEEGLTPHGAPRVFGSTTGSFEDPVLIPVEKLAQVKGIMGEQTNVRPDSLAWLKDHMGETGELPKMTSGSGEYAPFIQVDQNGVPWLNEGNHRVMAANSLGWSHMPVEVRYFNGGEDVPGAWAPDALLADHATLQDTPRIPKPVGPADKVIDAPTTPEEIAAVLDEKPPEAPSTSPTEADKIMRRITKSERALLTPEGETTIRKLLEDPRAAGWGFNVRDMVTMALGGRAKRGWYKNSAAAIQQVFGDDAPRFASFLAALSPRTSVESNLRNALNSWKNWTSEGRPTDPAQIMSILGRSVEGKRGEESVLGAWRDNAITALTHPDPVNAILSGPKADSFMRNLLGDFNEMTNDTWQARAMGVAQEMFAGINRTSKGVTTTGLKGPGYIAANALTREAAAKLKQMTRQDWTPAEVQETVWSFIKTLWEARGGPGEVRDMRTLLKEGAVPDNRIADTPDFATLFRNAEHGKTLRDAGYGEQLDQLHPLTYGHEFGTLTGPRVYELADRKERQFRDDTLPSFLNSFRSAAARGTDPVREISDSGGPFAGRREGMGKNPLAKLAKQRFDISDTDKTKFKSYGISTPTMLELRPGADSAQAFHGAISAAKESQGAPGAAVTVYGPEKYASMRLFLTNDGKAGFALHGDDIVSVFNTKDGPHKGVSPYLLTLAVQKGGRKLDCFDTVLPRIYSAMGFEPVARNPFSREYAPEGWDYNAMLKFNGGEPDVVHMALNPNGAERMTVGPEAYGKSPNRESIMTNDYDAASAANSARAHEMHMTRVEEDFRKSADRVLAGKVKREWAPKRDAMRRSVAKKVAGNSTAALNWKSPVMRDLAVKYGL